LGELVEPVDVDAPLEGFPPLLQAGVVGLALHRQHVLEGTALPGRGMQDVLVGSKHVFDDTDPHRQNRPCFRRGLFVGRNDR